MFTPNVSGSINPTTGVGDHQMKVILGQVEETLHQLMARMQNVSPGDFVALGAEQNPKAFRKAIESEYQTDLRASERTHRFTGAY
jgi:hypothetical protein